MASSVIERVRVQSVTSEQGPAVLIETSTVERMIEGTVSGTHAREGMYSRWGKRAFDLVGAVGLLVLLAVPILAIAILVRLTTEGRIFYIQQRMGLGRRPFMCLKFRTMVRDADSILSEDSQLQNAMAVSWKLPNDPRITSPGKVLRAHSLDELPQLFNVIRGEMSLVGPRPYMPHELDGEFGPHADLITSVRPGMTGLWQVSGRSHLAPVDRIALDERYVGIYTFRYDLTLLVRTFKVIFNRNGAF